MPAVKCQGKVIDAEGAVIILVVSGQDFHFNNSYLGTFSKTLNLPKGKYFIIVYCLTDGEMLCDITGNDISVKPAVPGKFDKNNKRKTYDLIV